MSDRNAKRPRLMTPAEAEFDVTDDREVSLLLARHSGPVRSSAVSMSGQPDVSSDLRSMGSLRTRP